MYYGYVYGESYKEVKDQIIRLRAAFSFENKSLYQYKGSVKDWFERWLVQQIAPKVKQSTYVSYQHKLTTYLFPDLGNKPLVKLTQEDLQNWLQHLQERLSASSIRVIFRLVNSGLEAAEAAHLRVDNPGQGLSIAESDGQSGQGVNHVTATSANQSGQGLRPRVSDLTGTGNRHENWRNLWLKMARH
ncbi:hypothetical protein I6N95_17445 [Vagococcus sp. BWB3-3]|uniref:Core-binding (CB) domain-containing protein n=1 Tax=Vagococcus allomyrinae TaxID=2794353 RepID=A0A940PDH5_9ENTE|nr:hypothetical protein [Vagococcus allomyrinae]